MRATVGKGSSRIRAKLVAGIIAAVALSGSGSPASAASSDEIMARLQTLEREVADLKAKNATILRENAALRDRKGSARPESAQPALAPVSPPPAPAAIKPADAAAPIPPATFAAAPVKALPPKALPAVVAFSWTGLYLGADVGFRSAVVDPSVTSAVATGPVNLLASCGAACPTGTPLDNTSLRAGVYEGYNWQLSPRWLVGVEADVGWADRSQAVSGQFYPGGNFSTFRFGDSSFSVTTKWDASIRGRVGFLVTPSILAYATGGGTWMSVEETSTCGTAGISPCNSSLPGAAALSPATITNSAILSGWTIGGGLEARAGDHWLARAEYRYADYGNWGNTDTRTCGGAPGCASVGVPAGGTMTVATSIRLQTHTALFGLAYKFGADGASDAYAAEPGPMAYYKAPPAVAAFSWTGPYIGAAVGLRSAVVDPSVAMALTGPVGPTTLCGIAGNPNFSAPCPASTSLDNQAFRAGLYGGFNYQFAPRWVAGLEGDWGWADESRAISGQFYPGGNPLFVSGTGDSSFSVTTKWDASIRGRLGFLVTPSILAYAIGGATWMRVEETSACGTIAATCTTFPGLGTFAPATISHGSTRPGWTIGGGLEGHIWGNWLARAEYRYADYGSWENTDVRTCPPGIFCFLVPAGTTVTATTSTRLQTHTALFGLAHKFDWPN